MRSITIILALILCSTQLFAQKAAADAKFKLLEYADAIPLYEKYIGDHPAEYNADSCLAVSYRLTNNITKAVAAYSRLVQLPESKPDDLFELVKMYQVMQNDPEARKYAELYKQKTPGDKADSLVRALDLRAHLMSTVNDFTIVNKTAIYPFSILSAYPFSGKLVVTAEKRDDKSNKWTGRSYTDIYVTDPEFSTLTEFAEDIMTDLDNGIPTFTGNDQVMYFTNVNKEAVKVNKVNTRKLHIV